MLGNNVLLLGQPLSVNSQRLGCGATHNHHCNFLVLLHRCAHRCNLHIVVLATRCTNANWTCQTCGHPLFLEEVVLELEEADTTATKEADNE